MDSNLKRVLEFHTAFNSPINISPVIPEKAECKLRCDLLIEEVNELVESIENNDIVEVLDALTDIQYVLDGTYITFGMHNIKEDALVEVHRSNMTKLDDNMRPIFRDDGKILKGPNFSKPNFNGLL